MRLNRFIALTTNFSRRSADELISTSRVKINGIDPTLGQTVGQDDAVTLDGKTLRLDSVIYETILLNKPYNYVCSRDGQGSKTIYELLPKQYHHLNPVGRLDKDSSGLLVMTNDGKLAHNLTHPSFQKEKIYEIRLNIALKPEDYHLIKDTGVMLDDGLSRFHLNQLHNGNYTEWQVVMKEGRNRQIRRTFSALDYTVKRLHRTKFGAYSINSLKSGEYKQL